MNQQRAMILLSTTTTALLGACGSVAATTADGGGDELLIDGLDDGDAKLPDAGGRSGGWYTFNDMTAGAEQTPSPTFAPTAGGADGTGYCAKTTGHGFSTWGAALALDFNHPANVTIGSYDASAYAGVRFKAKGNVTVRVMVPTEEIIDSQYHGRCENSDTHMCGDLYGRDVALTADWVDVDVPFAQLAQRGWGAVIPFDAKATMGLQFSVDKDATFDFSIDDLRFYK